MELYETQIGKWFSLGRIQTAPLTASLLSVAYATSGEHVLHPDILPLFAVLIMGHWGVFAHNDIVDRDYDKQKDTVHYKPVANGDIKLPHAKAAVLSVLVMSALLCVMFMQSNAVLLYIGCVATGITYNLRSKETAEGPLILAAWGAIAVAFAATYGGMITQTTVLFATSISAFSFWLIFCGDILDAGYDEDGLIYRLGARVTHHEYYDQKMFLSSLKVGLTGVGSVSVIFLGLSRIAFIGQDGAGMLGVARLTVVTILMMLCLLITVNLVRSNLFDRDYLKKRYMAQLALTTICILITATVFVRPEAIAVLFATSTGWELATQKVQYGDWFFFP